MFLAGCALVITRRPDAVFGAQFYAEDGRVWYQDAFEVGARSLLFPAGGYLNTLSRLIAMVAQLAPLSHAPLVMNLFAIVFQVLPVSVMLSSRFANVDFRLRLIGALGYLAAPNCFEIHANTTNIQFHLALLACLLVLAEPARRPGWRIFDVTTLVVLSLDSVFGLFLAPVAGVCWWVRREQWSRIQCVTLLLVGSLQIFFVLTSHSRVAAPTGANVIGLVHILGRQLFAPSLLGLSGVRGLAASQWSFGVDLGVVLVGVAVLTVALARAPLELKLFILFAAGGLAASLARPQASDVGPQWAVLQIPGADNRYFFLPMLAFLAALIWMASRSAPRIMRVAAGLLLVLLPYGVWRDWRHEPFVDLQFQRSVEAFNQAAPGVRVVIPIYPPPWTMELTKR